MAEVAEGGVLRQVFVFRFTLLTFRTQLTLADFSSEYQRAISEGQTTIWIVEIC
jgi:hypothetical protein